MKVRVVIAGLLLGSIFMVSCAKERDAKLLVANSNRVPKAALNGTWVFLRTMTDVSYPGGDDFLASGLYMDGDKLVQIELKENSLDIVSIDPLFKFESAAQANGLLASFPVKHVDVLRKQNPDGKDTHEEEETESRNVWQNRAYVKVDLTRNLVDIFPNVKKISPVGGIEIDAESGVINFAMTKQLGDDTLITEKFSLKRFEPSSTYEQKEYPRTLQERFGVFKTVTYKFDKFGRITQELKKEFMNRWDTSKPVTYHLSANFPEHLKPSAKKVFADWNQAFKVATGKDVLVLEENSGQAVGDLRYNMVVYVDGKDESSLLGYGPSVTNPRTGEILKADVFLYGNTLKRALFNERQWAEQLGESGRRVGVELRSGRPEAALGTLTGIKLNKGELSKLSRVQALPSLTREQVKARFGSAANVLKTLTDRIYKDNSQRITRMNEDILGGLADGSIASLSDEELEVRIFTPLLAHELGHNLGLRHNFMGSADEKHFHPTGKSSSVMDYGFLASHEPEAAGPYDAATIQVAYGNDPEENKRLLAENLLFCTDEHLFDARNGLCQQFDAGATLEASTLNQFKRYVASYSFNNLRMDRVHFNGVDDEYINRLFRYLLPLRLTFDHANAVITAGTAALNNPGPETLRELWLLLRLRIEADKASTQVVDVPIVPGMTVKVDIAKLLSVIADAENTRQLAFAALSTIVTEDQRPNYDLADPIFRDLQVRGVLYDKIFALLVMSLRTPDPLGGGAGVSMFEPMHLQMSSLFGGILSNTETVSIPMLGIKFTDLKFYDQNLREFAFDMLRAQIEAGGLESGEMKEMINLSKISGNDPDAADLVKIGQIRQELRALYVSLDKETDEVKRNALLEKLAALQEQLDAINVASIPVRDGIELKSKVMLSELGGIETATGHFVKHNLNFIEDRLAATRARISEIDAALPTTPPEGQEALIAERAAAADLALLFTRYLDTERIMVERMYREYAPRS